MVDELVQPPAKASLRVGRVAAPLREQVLDVMRQAILDFHYKPGQRLIERQLIEEIGVSRTTIREVMRELEAEGLVTTVPQKGAIVRVPTPEQAAEVYELAARNFVERASDEQVARLRAATDQFAAAVANDEDTRALLRAKDALYEVLLEGAANEEARNILNGLQARVRVLRAASMSNPGRSAKIVSELEELMSAIERRDPDAAAKACARHLNRAEASGLKGISSFAPEA
jgi:GntR family transcriptional regulator, trigonelline degradation regulator